MFLGWYIGKKIFVHPGSAQRSAARKNSFPFFFCFLFFPVSNFSFPLNFDYQEFQKLFNKGFNTEARTIFVTD